MRMHGSNIQLQEANKHVKYQLFLHFIFARVWVHRHVRHTRATPVQTLKPELWRDIMWRCAFNKGRLRGLYTFNVSGCVCGVLLRSSLFFCVYGIHACVWDARVCGTRVRSCVCTRHDPCTSKNEMQTEAWYISCLLPSCRRMLLLCIRM